MSACVESMFYVRETPWHGLGVRVEDALSSEDALRISGLDWPVVMCKSYMEDPDGNLTLDPDNFYTARFKDGKYEGLGKVGKQYTIVQNVDAFAFSDALLGEGVKYETAGSLNGGKRVWILARLPEEYTILGDKYVAYLVLTNTHDGKGSMWVALTPIRVVCQNTLNAALSTATRSWSAVHKRSINNKIDEARYTLGLADAYMKALNEDMEKLAMVKISPIQFERIVLPKLICLKPNEKETDQKLKNINKQRAELRFRYQYAPDLQGVGFNGARLIQAVADYVDHNKPLKETKNWRENRFAAQIQGNEMLDKARDIAFALV